jgi:hypothetical protein
MVRRLPAPWIADKIPGGYVVRDANGKALAYVYSRATESEAMQAKAALISLNEIPRSLPLRNRSTQCRCKYSRFENDPSCDR